MRTNLVYTIMGCVGGYAQDAETVQAGVKIIAEEVAKVYASPS